ncbi:hypothetical protein K504DRAFT_160210 [Pleomassaria siparia CBS 279.74]|uniref:Uncharacterized protein n=1 Tax=Pleomassaria siparia CBS 279.74 TaxID=1314801 RepID=A0A6G1JUI9_9PLEO|nr:hypothetical protein K504DRAFT_160210 [Pleomassaria siparia CBS 279.74]
MHCCRPPKRERKFMHGFLVDAEVSILRLANPYTENSPCVSWICFTAMLPCCCRKGCLCLLLPCEGRETWDPTLALGMKTGPAQDQRATRLVYTALTSMANNLQIVTSLYPLFLQCTPFQTMYFPRQESTPQSSPPACVCGTYHNRVQSTQPRCVLPSPTSGAWRNISQFCGAARSHRS